MMATSPWATVLGTLLATALGYGVYSGYRVRSRVNQLRKMGMPMPEWSWLGGHLPVFQRYIARYPSDAFVSILTVAMGHDIGNPDIWYMDLWPFLAPTVQVCSPEAATQVSNKYNLPKPEMYRTMFDPMIGGPSLLTMNGKEWKYWRALFNPGFAPAYLLEQVPSIVDSVEVLCGKLQALEGTVFCLEEIVTRLTMDIIMKVVLDLDLNYQKGPHPLPDALRTMISWTSFGNPLNKYQPIRTFILRYYGKVMDRLIKKELKERFEEYKRSLQAPSISIAASTSKKSKSVMSLTLESFMEEQTSDNKAETATLDEQFIAYATYQLRLFLFAGHDTTTSVLVYAYHMLHKHANIRTCVIDEHDSVFGKDPSVAAEKLRQSPALVNQLPFTLAVIKETMRLFPPAGAFRAGSANVSLVSRDGTQYPTADCLVSLGHHAIHHNPRVWPRVEEFLPERWLVEEGHELHPQNGAFRGFEQGQRSCIGQNLSLLELRIALVLTMRTFRITPAYEKWDLMKKQGIMSSLRARLRKGQQAKPEIGGDRAYQIEKGGAHPKDGYPCEVELL